jgi:hypothetical protein
MLASNEIEGRLRAIGWTNRIHFDTAGITFKDMIRWDEIMLRKYAVLGESHEPNSQKKKDGNIFQKIALSLGLSR